ncbi:uncharacterized protein GLRG_00488 [Colletotrichum graminicola M1.001]|uniref:Uncharacterized protein n=1 Tax=Colletotrichum graminicola (strain M1.001 / M2 / FGSC 10212) TaxID=645133 RepID=E3Q432_COLGM|nr:uncharacterized protein GLRG_00488 [Colletotrichum graminicola M1.001]EFQ25344.1 hypothetical protein GLRG_00488 [Colletotrichum graminicola M1.001]
MDGFLDWVCPQAEKMLDFLIDMFGIIFGPIMYGLLWMTSFSSIGFAIWIIVGSLILGARKLFQDATRSLKDQWRALSDNDPNKPRIPVWYRRPSYAVCDPITDSSNPSKDGKKKKSDKKKLSLRISQTKAKKIATRLRRKTSRLEYRHRQEHKTNPWPTRKHQKTVELNSKIEKLKSCNLELSAYLRTVEASRAELLQRQTTWIYPYDKDLEIPGRIPTICARLPVPEFRISDVVGRRKAKPAAPFNITFYSMPETIVRSKASAPAARSLSRVNNKTIEQTANQPVTTPAVIPSPPITIPTVNTLGQIPKHTESPVTRVLGLPQPLANSVPLPKSPPQPLAQSPSTPPSLIHPSSQIVTPAFPAVSKNNNGEVSQEDRPAKESKKEASDYNTSSKSNNDENNNTALPSISEPDEDAGKSKDENLTLLPDSDENDVEGRDDNFPPLPDSDTGSDGEDDDEDRNDRPDNAGSVIPSVIQQLVETFSDPAPAQESPFTSSSAPAIIKPNVQEPSITPLGTQMEVDIHNENVTEEEHTKLDAMDVDVQDEKSGKECGAAKDEMEVDIEHEKTKDDTGKDKMEVDIENETGATTDEMQLDDMDLIRGLKDVDMVNASQKIQKPTGDIEMRDGPTTPSIAPNPNVFAEQNARHTIAEQPSTPLPNKHCSHQGMQRPQVSNVRGETMSDKAPPPAPESKNQRPVIVIRHNESRRQRALEAKRRWLLAQEQEAADAPEPAMEQFRNRPPPMVSSQGVSARDNRLLLSGTPELRRELLHRLQALWPLLPKAEVDRSLAEWRKLLNPAGKHALPDNTYIPRDAFEREAAEWMKKVLELMTKLKVVPEVGSLLETWRECMARQEPLPEPEDN